VNGKEGYMTKPEREGKHNYFINEHEFAECSNCGLLRSTIENTPPKAQKHSVDCYANRVKRPYYHCICTPKAQDWEESLEPKIEKHLASAITHGYNDAQVDNDGLGEVCRLEAKQNLRNAMLDIRQTIASEKKNLIEEIKEIAWDCLYEEWVEVATPRNFEAGKLNCTLFEERLSHLEDLPRPKPKMINVKQFVKRARRVKKILEEEK
jgi:hypothetical protein